MKKQILFLAIFTLAVFLAGTTKSFGQLLPRTTPNYIDYLTCQGQSYPLHPMPGIPYTYRMDGASGEEHADQWTWFATKDSVFINSSGLNIATRLQVASGQLLNASTNYGTSGSLDSVTITWTPEILANTLYEGVASTTNFPSPTFVVGYATGENCADNIEVYEINPIPAFVVDIANITETGVVLDWGIDTAECVDIVRAATYNSATDSLIMDYGTDTLYFEIVASNFVTSWTPYFQIMAGLTGSQTADIGVAISYANAQSGTWITGTTEQTGLQTTDSTSFGGIELTALDPDEVANGVSVFARVVIHNNTFESLSSQTFTLAVNGRDYSDQWDLEDDTCADPTTAVYDTDNDLANQIIRPRPAINHNTPDDGTVEPNTIINKQRN